MHCIPENALASAPIYPLLAVPPAFEYSLGYLRDARFIGIYWDLLIASCVVCDGRHEYVGDSSVWISFLNGPHIERALRPYSFGNENELAQHILILDRRCRRFFVLSYDSGEQFLRLQQTGLLR